MTRRTKVPSGRRAWLIAAMVVAALVSSFATASPAQADSGIQVSGGSLYLDPPGTTQMAIESCLLYRLYFLDSHPADSIVKVTVKSTGQTMQIRKERSLQFPGDWPTLSGAYCLHMGTFADTDDFVFSVVSREGATLAVSDSQHLSLVPATEATLAVLERQLIQVLRTSRHDDLSLCLKLGAIFPSHYLKASQADITVACLDFTVTGKFAMLGRLIATTSVVAMSNAITETWVYRHDIDCPPSCTPEADPNPDPQPGPVPPTPDPVVLERQQVIQRIQESQRKVALDDEQAGDAADKCLASQRALVQSPHYSGSPTPCLSYALFFPGMDAGAAAIHDRDAIRDKPWQAVLTYMSGKDRKGKEFGDLKDGWYDRASNRPNACQSNYRNRKRAHVECDEYPFYSTTQAGPGASLREVYWKHNRDEGIALGLMYDNPTCRMARDPAGSRKTPFMVIPVAVEITAPIPAVPRIEAVRGTKAIPGTAAVPAVEAVPGTKAIPATKTTSRIPATRPVLARPAIPATAGTPAIPPIPEVSAVPEVPGTYVGPLSFHVCGDDERTSGGGGGGISAN